jgi:hypothetical protein
VTEILLTSLTSFSISAYAAETDSRKFMQFDPALAAQDAFCEAEAELGTDWDAAVELEDTFSSNAGITARDAYEGLLALARQYPNAYSFHAFCIYITWQQVTEETIAHHFETGLKLCEAYLASREARTERDVEQIEELYGSFKAGLGLVEEDEIQAEYRRDTPKGGD